MFEAGKVVAVFLDVLSQGLFCPPDRVLQDLRVREGEMQVVLDKLGRVRDGRHVAANGFRVNLAKGIVQRLAEPQSAVNRRVKVVKKAQLEVVRTLKVVAKFTESQGKGRVCNLLLWIQSGVALFPDRRRGRTRSAGVPLNIRRPASVA